MTVTTTTPGGGPPAPREDLVSVTIDGVALSVPKGTLVIRAAELLGIQIPRFCDHPLLDPVGACRQCLVDVEGQRKPMASCTTTVTDGMVVKTQLTSPIAKKAQEGVVEMLLINHPLDCPICDKGGECPLQNQAMDNGRATSRFTGTKRTFTKPIPISTGVLLDRERCVSCARCTRFSEQIAGDPFIALIERGAEQQVGVSVAGDKPFESYFSGNTVQICPVGALTGTTYRFRSRPFDLVSSPSVCEHCASGCAQRTDHRRGKVLRRLAGDDPEVNEEWNCDKGRWAFAYERADDRITTPLVRDGDTLVPASWPEAMAAAAEGLTRARGRTGVLTGGRVTLEDAYAYAKFARLALDTNDVDFRARAHSGEEAEILAAHVAGTSLSRGGVSYAVLDEAPAVLLVGFEPEEESPIVFLRLRKAAHKHGTRVAAVAPFTTDGLRKLDATVLRSAPGTEPRILAALAEGSAGSGLDDDGLAVAEALREPGAVILGGERLAQVPGALTAAVALAEESGARFAWVPRRAGERGAVEAGALPNLLPGGRPATDVDARGQVATVWGVDDLPAACGRDTAGILLAARDGRLGALVVGGVEVEDLPDPEGAVEALEAVPFLVSLEIRRSAVTERADVVFPVAVVSQKAGSFLNWEGRIRPFPVALRPEAGGTFGGSLPTDLRVLDRVADEMGVSIALPTVDAARREIAELGPWRGARDAVLPPLERPLPNPGSGEAVLATWRMLLDAGRLQDGEPNLAGTARAPVVRLSAATAEQAGLAEGDPVTVSGPRGSVTFPLAVGDLPDRVVWLPANTPGARLTTDLGAAAGDVVRFAAANGAVASPLPPGGPIPYPSSQRHADAGPPVPTPVDEGAPPTEGWGQPTAAGPDGGEQA